MPLCECGCGKSVGIRRGGRRKGFNRFCRGHHVRAQRQQYAVDEHGCWMWLMAITDAGYGNLRINGRMLPAHRVYYEQRHGPVPAGMQLDHLCRNRACVNPDHLEPVTHAENCRRGANTKLTAIDAEMIRAMSGTCQDVGEVFGIGASQVSRIRRGLCWTD